LDEGEEKRGRKGRRKRTIRNQECGLKRRGRKRRT